MRTNPTITHYKGYTIEIRDGYYRMMLYPDQLFARWGDITSHIDKLIESTNEKSGRST